MTKITPIFLLSLPRSGSTLVQRVLASNSEIVTTAEPWFLLPHLDYLREDGVIADYDSESAHTAIHDFIQQMPNKQDDYVSSLRSFAEDVYSKFALKGEKYFLDKTPRYSLISHQLHEVFPDARFIYLWRNPLSVIASSIETWGKPGQWNVHRIHVDLFVGLPRLVSSYKEHKDRIYSCRYDNLVRDRNKWKGLFEYLKIEYEETVFSELGSKIIHGAMGDKSGVEEYQALSSQSSNKWKKVLNSPIRKFWCIRYLKWLGSERLSIIGYDLDELVKEIRVLPNSYKTLPMDILAMIYGVLYGLFEIPMLAKQIKRYIKGKVVIAYR